MALRSDSLVRIACTLLAVCLPSVVFGGQVLRLLELGNQWSDGLVEIQSERGSGLEWLALIQVGDIAELRRVVTHIETVDADISEVSVSAPGASILIGGSHLEAGELEVARLDQSRRKITFRGQEFLISEECEESGDGGAERACKVFLDEGSKRAMLAETAYTSDADYNTYASVRWAGDLDRDGRLDIVLDVNSYNNGETSLWLSGAAGVGEILRSVSVLHSQGC